MLDRPVKMTVALPLYKARDIAWLALDGLCRQRGVPVPWELIVAEEAAGEVSCQKNGDAFGEKEIRAYTDRLAAAGCCEIIYIPLGYWIPLARKWRLLARMSAPTSELWLIQDGDDYPPADRLAETWALKNAGDWINTERSYYYDIASERGYLWDRRRLKKWSHGINQAVRTELMRQLPTDGRWHGLSTFAFRSCCAAAGGDLAMVWNDSDAWRGGFNTAGMNNLSSHRKGFEKSGGACTPAGEDIFIEVPDEIVQRLRGCRPLTVPERRIARELFAEKLDEQNNEETIEVSVDGQKKKNGTEAKVSAKKILRPLIVMHRPYPKVAWRNHQGFMLHAISMGLPARFYGPEICFVDESLREKFSPARPLREAVKRTGANCVILYRSGHIDLEFLTFPGRRSPNKIARWAKCAAVDIRKLGVPVVLIDVDFHQIEDPSCDISSRVDCHLMRAIDSVDASPATASDELPFSVDPALYCQQSPTDRRGICYSGHYLRDKRGPQPRWDAIKRLADQVDLGTELMDFPRQVSFYQRHIAAIACDGGQRCLTAKHFEIPAAGCVLLTNGHNGVERYLPADSFVTYRDDAADVYGLWEAIRDDPAAWTERAAAARDHVMSTANHTVRWGEAVAKINRHCGTEFSVPAELLDSGRNITL